VGTQFRNAVFKSGLLGLDGSHDLIVLLGRLCLECSSLVLSLTDLSLSAGVRFRLSLLCLSLSISNQPLRTSPCLRQLGGGTRLSFSQLLFSSFACLSQHGIRFRACLVGETVRHVLSHAQDAGCLHVGLWGRSTGGASSRTCCSAGCGGSCWCSSGGGLRRLQRGVFLLRSFQFLLGCFQLLTNLSGLILSCLYLSGVISSGRSCCWLRRLSLFGFSLSLGCFILGLVSFCLSVSQLLFVFCAKFGLYGLAYSSLIYSRCSASGLCRTRTILELLLQFVVLILELG